MGNSCSLYERDEWTELDYGGWRRVKPSVCRECMHLINEFAGVPPLLARLEVEYALARIINEWDPKRNANGPLGSRH